ncbi:hypothetical protein [Bradyrhizobium liaoningense]|uniref:hypothetical protein n=1 Tax=Bradyrhizobium liaoningense TaxID=43992 RepID=UPI0004AD0EA9|nr:hypothetical protein [Bradyrhizobium liaoningense]
MTKLNSTEKKTLEVLTKSFFTFKGDSHFRSYRQATAALNRLERLGLVKREDHDQSMYVATALAREWSQYPNVALEDVRAWLTP